MSNTKKETSGFGQLSINKKDLNITPQVTIKRFLHKKLLPLLSSSSVNDKEKHNTSEWAIQHHTTADRTYTPSDLTVLTILSSRWHL